MEGLFQPMHLVFILVIVLILFGPGKLPELGKGLGKGIREFKDALKGGRRQRREERRKEGGSEESLDHPPRCRSSYNPSWPLFLVVQRQN